MKKIACFALAALTLLACQREVNDPQASNVPTYTVTITARLAETRTAYDDAGKFAWVAGDEIHVLVTDGTAKKQVAFTTAEAGPEVPFTGQVDEGFQVTGEAAYALDFDAGKQKWILPESVTVDPDSPLSSLPLLGAADSQQMYQFKTATGILKFTVENVPVETAYVALETQGDGALCGELADAPANGVVTMAALAGGGKKLVSKGAPAEINTTMTYWFFVPAGTLPAEKTTFSVCDASDHVIKDFVFKKDITVQANRIANIAPVRFDPVKEGSRQLDSLALVAIYDASDGANWKEERRWDLTKPINEWDGVKLTDGRVTQLAITAQGVINTSWTLPQAIGDLTELTVLKLNQCKLAGELPEEVFTLSKLTDLWLQNNDLTGTFSDKFTRLSKLKNLYIDKNANLTGTLPPEIGNLKELTRISISQTSISGPIPVELGQCECLLQFMAFNAKLSGTLPDIWDMPVLQTVMIYGNEGLTGPLPASLGKLKSLANGTAPSIQIYNCNITGNIPASFASLPEKTKQVNLQGNKMSGVIPRSVSNHPNFSSWKIADQQEGYGLTLAPAPSRQLDSLALVAIYDASDGANWKEERRWDLTKPINEWDGVKLTDGRVTQLAITAQGVINTSWTLPQAIGDLTELTVLKLNQCKLAGELPEEVFTLSKLTDLWLQNNDLTGTFSDKYTQLSNLKNLYIDRNKNLQGSLPASIGNLKKLESINIAQTQFSGPIPDELSQCSALKNIMAYSNSLSGEIPDFWDQLPNIGVLQLYGNPGITGPLPPSIGTLKKATGIQLKNCNLTGNIPASFGGLEKCNQLFLNGNKLSGVIPAEVQAHPKFLPDTGWKYTENILPQQDGYGLTIE